MIQKTLWKYFRTGWCFWDGGGWFRVFGIGIHWKDIVKNGLMFSERNGYRRFIVWNRWVIKFLGWMHRG